METNPVTCKLKIPKNLDGKTPGFLVNFSNGNINVNHSTELKFSCYRRAAVGSSGVGRVLIANNGHFNYRSGSDEIKDDRNTFNYLIGVRNKTSGRMKVFDAISFHLKPVLKENAPQSIEPESRNVRERRDELDINFGSKDKKRSLVARQKYSMASASLDDALEDISINDSNDNANRSVSFSSTSSNIDYLPPQNKEAQTVDLVYNISDIISEEEEEHLDKRAEELLNDLPSHLTQWKVDGTFCEYILDHLVKSDLNHVKTKYLLYYNYLVIFSKLLAPDIKKRDPAPQIPEPIKSCILDRFTTTSSTPSGKVTRNYPVKMKDKVLAYILVLALIIDDFHVNLAQVQKGTKHSMTKLANIAQALGCHIQRLKVENCVTSFAVLKLPLFVSQKFKKY